MPRKYQQNQYFYGTTRMYRLQGNPEGIVNTCGTGLVCIFIMKCSRLVKFNLNAIAKSEYYSTKIKECQGNQRTIFTFVNKVLLANEQTTLPNIINSDKDMAHCVNFFLLSKYIKYTRFLHLQHLITWCVIGRSVMHVYDVSIWASYINWLQIVAEKIIKCCLCLGCSDKPN